ncbi:MAG: hypothetical protein V4507_09100 [Verrucomicrobiota bacterium]
MDAPDDQRKPSEETSASSHSLNPPEATASGLASVSSQDSIEALLKSIEKEGLEPKKTGEAISPSESPEALPNPPPSDTSVDALLASISAQTSPTPADVSKVSPISEEKTAPAIPAPSVSSDLDIEAILKQAASPEEYPVTEKETIIPEKSPEIVPEVSVEKIVEEPAKVTPPESTAPSTNSDSDVDALLQSLSSQMEPEPKAVEVPTKIPETLEKKETPADSSSDLDIEAILKEAQGAETPSTSVHVTESVQKPIDSETSLSSDLDVEALLKQVQNESPAPSSNVTEPPVVASTDDKVEPPSQTSADPVSTHVTPKPESLSSLEQASETAINALAPEVKETPGHEPLSTPHHAHESVEKIAETIPVSASTHPVTKSITQTLDKGSKEFDISTDPDVVAMKGRMKEKIQNLLKTFVNYKTFSVAFILQIPKVVTRRRKAKLAIREFSEWIESEKAQIQKIEDPIKKSVLEKGSIVFEHEMLQLRRKGVNWVQQGWKKSALILIWLASLFIGLSVGVPSLVRTYIRKPLQKVEVKEIEGAENIPVEAVKKPQGPSSYLLLSCEDSQMGRLGRIRVYDREGKELANFPPILNPMKKKLLTQIPSGECGVIIETGEYPIVGSLELTPNQRRFIDLSKWTDSAARALVEIQSTPDGIPIVCNGAWVGKGFAKVYLIAGVHRIWAALPNFPAQEQHIMIVDDRELTIGVNINMGRFVFKIADNIKKLHPQFKIMVNGSIVSDLDSHAVLSGYHSVKIMDAGRVVTQQEVKLDAAEEATFQIQQLEDGQLSAALASKHNLLDPQ